MPDHSDHNHHKSSDQPLGENTALCPVMKDIIVDKEEAKMQGRVREYGGQTYYLCCNTCVADFDANPQQYAK